MTHGTQITDRAWASQPVKYVIVIHSAIKTKYFSE